MPELINTLPFPNFRYYSEDNEGKEFGVIILKGTYEIDTRGRLWLAEEQAPLMLTDQCHGEVNTSSLWHPSDLVPIKPRADLIVNAVARTPDGKRVPSFACGISLSGPEGVLVEKKLRVPGPRYWLPQWRRPLTDSETENWQSVRKNGFRGWRLSEPEPVTQVPLRYELAYGGLIEKGVDNVGNPIIDCDPQNPIGRGIIDKDWTNHTTPQLAPQIEASNAPVSDPYQPLTPQSLGPIPPAWDPRLPRAGTYDEEWEKNVWPKWPTDYDFSFHNSAHPDLVVPRYLQGGDRIELTNLLPGMPSTSLTIPRLKPIAQFLRRDGDIHRADFVIDTCFLDIAADNRSDARVFLTWRLVFEPNVFLTAVLGIAPDDFVVEYEKLKKEAS